MTDKGYMLHITNTHNLWVLGGMVYGQLKLQYLRRANCPSLLYSVLAAQGSYTVCWLAQASTLTDTHTQSMVFGENQGISYLKLQYFTRAN